MSIRQGNKIISGIIQGGGFEVGDIGIAPLGIDESQGTRKYLNGQTISQEFYPEFTQKVKKMAETCPSISCSNDEFNQEVQLSALGQCGKFVIDNVNKKIRLPLIVNIQGLTDLSKAGVRVEAGLPNITGTFYNGDILNVSYPTSTSGTEGAFKSLDRGTTQTGGSRQENQPKGTGFDASLSNPIYGKSNTVQPEAIQYPFFIQVAVSVKNNVDITNEYQLNNPYSLLDCKWSDHKLANTSWLLSQGQYNSGTVYKAVYDLLLKEYSTPTIGITVKKNTEVFTDYDFVINISGTTFRLPVKTKLASGMAIKGNGTALGLTSNDKNYGIGYYATNYCVGLDTTRYGKKTGDIIEGSGDGKPAANQVLGVTQDSSKSGIETDNKDLFLYYYVGETVQNVNLIDIGGITELLVDLSNELDKKLNDSPSLDLVIDYKVNSDGSWYRKYKSGWIEQGGKYTAGANTFVNVTLLKPMANDLYYANARQYSWWNKDKYAVIQTIRTTTTTVSIGNVWDSGINGTWYACGQGV